MYKEDTIAAIATPAGEGGIAIIRISGPDAEKIARGIFSRSEGRNGTLCSHRLYYGTISEPNTGAALDEVLLTIMRKPHSYTTEDVVEIHCHGGPFLVRRLLGLVLSCGARHAEAGEFTKRAFLNGRLDLAQAEAVLDLIHARTDRGVSLALGQVSGKISSIINDLRDELADILVQVEAAIDFPEEEIELLQCEQVTKKIESLKSQVSALIESYQWGRLFREGARVCITGKPNVGKSSLLNALLGEERAIVTASPGTTRDVLEESINLDGIPVVLWDTAGIRETQDQVERIGVEFSRRRLADAHAALIVLDGAAGLSDQDLSVLELTKAKSGMIAVNKRDLPQEIDIHRLQELAFGKTVLSVSAKEGAGMEELKRVLRRLILQTDGEPEIVVNNVRHKASLQRTEDALLLAIRALNDRMPPDIVAVELQEANIALGEIVGIVSHDDILERIFTQFCIGK